MYRCKSSERFAHGDNKENIKVPMSADRKARSDSSTIRKPLLSTNVKVVLRMRGELQNVDDRSIFNYVKDENRIIYKNQQFKFDNIFAADVNQERVYKSVVENCVTECLRGINFCILAYGQTGSGKTYSMSGTETDPGIIPRFCNDLFTQIEKKNMSDTVYVSISFFEIYNEKIYDLLGAERKPLKIRGAEEVQIVDLTSIGVQSKEELNTWRKFGVNRRATATTLINELSSRSHAIFQLTIRRELRKVFDGVEKKKILVSHCFFVDLAGSEKISDIPNRQCETISINKSLLALQKVVDARASGCSFVNYRESALTRILKPCFSGNSISVILATAHPVEQYSYETLSTLRFVSKASKIEQKPVENEDRLTEKVQYLVAENEEYKKELETLRDKLITLQNAVDVDTPIAPCIIELFEDSSLNLWKCLEENAIITGATDEVVAIISSNTKGWCIIPKVCGIMVNGIEAIVDELCVVNHGDGVVVHGQKYFVFYLNYNDDPRTFKTYTAVKIEYVTKQYEFEKNKLIKEAIDDMKKEEEEVKCQLENELKQMRDELVILKSREKQSNNVAVTKEREECEKRFLDVVEMRDALKVELAKTENKIRKSIHKNEDDVAKELLLKMKARADLLNNVFNSVGKSRVFVFKVINIAAKNTVRLFNRKMKLYVDICGAEFEDFYNKVAEMYQSQMSVNSLCNVIDNYLYGGNFSWKSARGNNAHASNLFHTAVMNSIQEAAKRRRSTVVDVKKSLRKSVLVSHIKDESDVKTPIEEMQSFFCLYFQKDVNDDDIIPESNIASLLDACLEAKKNFEVFSGPVNFIVANSSQKKTLSIVGLARSISSTKLISTLSATYSQQYDAIESGVDHLYKAIYEHARIIKSAIGSWINASKCLQSTNGQTDTIMREINLIIEYCGQIAYVFALKILPRHQTLSQNIFAGYKNAIEEFSSDLKKDLEGGFSLKRKILKMVAEIILSIKNLVFNMNEMDEDITFDVLRCAMLMKEKIKVTTDDKLCKIIPMFSDFKDTCQCYNNLLGNELLTNIENFYVQFVNISESVMKPPIRRYM